MPELWEDPQALSMAEQGFSTKAVQPQSKAKPSKDASLHWQSEAKLAKQRQETRVSKQKRLQRGNQSQTRRINPNANERRGKSKGGNQDEVPTGSFTKLSHFISDALLPHWNSATLSAHLAMRFVVSFLSGWINQKKNAARHGASCHFKPVTCAPTHSWFSPRVRPPSFTPALPSAVFQRAAWSDTTLVACVYKCC